jgi:hypothetical protein
VHGWKHSGFVAVQQLQQKDEETIFCGEDGNSAKQRGEKHSLFAVGNVFLQEENGDFILLFDLATHMEIENMAGNSLRRGK